MKSKIINQTKLDNIHQFIKGKLYKSTVSEVVLICVENSEVNLKGVVIHPDNIVGYSSGDYSTNWNSFAFVPFHGTIELVEE